MAPSYDTTRGGWADGKFEPSTPPPDRYFDDCPEGGPPAPRQAAGEVTLKLLDWLVGSGSPLDAGRRAVLLAHVLHVGTVADISQRDLAALFHVTEGRVSQLLKAVRDSMADIGRG